MATDWYKKFEDRAEDREEARRNQVTASSTPEPKPVNTTVGVDHGSGGACKHEGF